MRQYIINVNGTPYDVALVDRSGGALSFQVLGQTYTVRVDVPPFVSPGSGQGAPSPAMPRPTQATPVAVNAREIRAPMPGIVVSVPVKVGDKVSAGQSVAVLEAMKMENAVASQRAGTVAEVRAKKGEEVAQGAVLVVLS